MGFAANLNKLCERAGEKAALVVRRAALELQSQMIERTPVDTGRAKGSWQAGVGVVNTADGAADKTGAAALGRSQTVLESWKPGQTIYLTLSLPYAKVMEYGQYGNPPGSANGPKTVGGYSRQAPAGMVRLAVQSYGEAVSKAVASLK